MGVVVALLVGGGLGWLAGHLAVLIPSNRWNSLPVALAALSTERRLEHYLGALLGALGFGLAYLVDASISDIAVKGILMLLLISMLIIDLRHHLVYPLMALAGFLAGLVLNPLVGELSWWNGLLAAFLAALAFLGLFVVGRLLFRVEALGFGDVLLAGMIGSMVGLELVASTLFLGILISGLASAALLVMRLKGRQDFVPFGSGMCLAAILVLVIRN